MKRYPLMKLNPLLEDPFGFAAHVIAWKWFLQEQRIAARAARAGAEP